MKIFDLFLIFHESEAETHSSSQTVGERTHKLFGKVVLNKSVSQSEKTEEFSKAIYNISMQMLMQKMSLKEIAREISAQTEEYFSINNAHLESLNLRHEIIEKNKTTPKVNYYYEWNNEQNYIERQ